jgi:gluconolactonase
MQIEIVAEGLGFPEGPVVMADGSVILVEIQRGTLTRVWNGKSEVIANLGGGPNGAALGPDGAIYVCNNGGFEWSEMAGYLLPGHAAADYETGRIERVDLATGKVDRLYTTVGGNMLKGPNDLVFDRAGNFYFTDHGKSYARTRDLGGLFYASPNGASVQELVWGQTSPNGVGLSPDESTVYMADTMTGRLWAYDLATPGVVNPASPLQPGRIIASLPGWTLLDSLAVEASGQIAVATLVTGGITVFDPAGTTELIPFPDLLVTNIAFGGDDMCDAYVTLSGTGKLAKVRWPRPGLKLNFAS